MLSGKGGHVTATALDHDGGTTAPVEQVAVEDIKVDHGGATGMAGFLRSATASPGGASTSAATATARSSSTTGRTPTARSASRTGRSTARRSTTARSRRARRTTPSASTRRESTASRSAARTSTAAPCSTCFVTMSEYSPEGSRVTLENNLFEAPTTFEDKCCSAYSVLLRGDEPDDGNSPAIDDWDIRYNTFEGGLALGVPGANPIGDGGLRRRRERAAGRRHVPRRRHVRAQRVRRARPARARRRSPRRRRRSRPAWSDRPAAAAPGTTTA